MTPIRTAIAVLTGLVALVLLMAGCAKEPEQERPMPGQGPVPADTTSGTPKWDQTRDKQTQTSTHAEKTRPGPAVAGRLARLVDLGKGTCVPCKMMAPILEELKAEYQGRAVVEVIDLRDSPEAAREYAIRVIPTQIFFDPGGREVWRHEGFLAKADIIVKFKEMGVPPDDD
jgi:thioredoxin 1